MRKQSGWGPLTFLLVTGLRIFPGGQFKRAFVQSCIRLKCDPANSLVEMPRIAESFLPIRLGQRERRRLNGALNEEAVASPPLSRSGDLLPALEQIKLFVADETLAGLRFSRT